MTLSTNLLRPRRHTREDRLPARVDGHRPVATRCSSAASRTGEERLLPRWGGGVSGPTGYPAGPDLRWLRPRSQGPGTRGGTHGGTHGGTQGGTDGGTHGGTGGRREPLRGASNALRRAFAECPTNTGRPGAHGLDGFMTVVRKPLGGQHARTGRHHRRWPPGGARAGAQWSARCAHIPIIRLPDRDRYRQIPGVLPDTGQGLCVTTAEALTGHVGDVVLASTRVPGNRLPGCLPRCSDLRRSEMQEVWSSWGSSRCMSYGRAAARAPGPR